MNRKDKKSPPGAAKKAKVSRQNHQKKNRSPAKTNNKRVLASKKAPKSNNRKSLLSTFYQSIVQPKRSSTAHKKTAERPVITRKNQRTSQETKLQFSLQLAVYAIAIIVGLSTILGTTVSIASSFQAPVVKEKTSNKPKNISNQAKLQQILTQSSLGQEISPLKIKLEELAKKYPELEPEVFLVDLDTKGFVSIRGQNKIASASTIKLPVLVAFFQDLDRGKIRLEEQLTMTKDSIAGGSGDMQYQEPRTKFTALETAEKMIVISDNTATNMLIERLGGMDELNQRFMTMGLTNTELNNPLPDLTGTNTTSSEDLGNLLIKIDNGELISIRSRDRLLHIMGNVKKDTLLPQGLESGALIAHKTGDIKSVLADVGTIDMPNGKRYIASMLVKRPSNSPQAQKFIQQASGIAYQYFKTPQSPSSILEDR